MKVSSAGVCRAVCTVAAGMLTGCSTQNVPLFFGEQVTWGLHVGNDSAADGVQASLGYGLRNVAVVPVTAQKKNGQAGRVVAKDGESEDVLSVFAILDGTGDSAKSGGSEQGAGRKVKLGRIFATGVAAQALTSAYKCRMQGQSLCDEDKKKEAAKEEARKLAKKGEATRQEEQAKWEEEPRGQNTAKNVFLPPLVFLQSDVGGLGLSTSVAEKGANATFGYTARSIALIPVTVKHGDGDVAQLSGYRQTQGDEKDSFTVIGEFSTESASTSFRYGLDRFFATGVAARNIAHGFQAAIEAQPPAGDWRNTNP